MDKRQKELIGTYFHARNVAIQNNSGIEPYELNKYVFENKLVDLNDLSSHDIFRHIKNNPQDIEYLKDVLHKLDPDKNNRYEFSYLIANNPDLMKYFDLNKLNDVGIFRILGKHPDLIKYEFFENNFNLLNGAQVSSLISFHEEFVKYMDLNKLNNTNINTVLKYKPHLYKYFKKKFKTYDGDEMGDLLYNKPELVDAYNWDFTKWNEMMFAEFFHLHPKYKKHKKLKGHGEYFDRVRRNMDRKVKAFEKRNNG